MLFLLFQEITINEQSLPQQTESFIISDCGLVKFRTNSFARCLDLDNIELSNLKKLELARKFYSRQESAYRELSNFTVSDIGEIDIADGSFDNFPKCNIASFENVGIPKIPEKGMEILSDHLIIKDSNIGQMEKSAIYSDAAMLSIVGNRIEKIGRGAIDAIVRGFDFMSNTVDLIEEMGLSVACMNGRIMDNVFANQVGSPFVDFGPDPQCVPDPDIDPYEEEEIAYNIVSNPTLQFTGNYFQTFTDELLRFPGANNVPLGALKISKNKVQCNCLLGTNARWNTSEQNIS